MKSPFSFNLPAVRATAGPLFGLALALWTSSPRGFAAARPLGVENVESVVHSAEHCILTLTQPNTQLKIGDGVDFVVGYGDATVFLHEVLHGVRDGVVETAWPVLGRGKLQ